MSGAAIQFPPTPVFKRILSSPSSEEWPSKRRRMTSEEHPTARSSSQPNWHRVYLHPNSPLERISPPSSTQYITPPDSCELPCSPSPSQSWAAVASPSSSSTQDSDESLFPLKASLDLVPTILSFPVPPVLGDMTPSPSITKSLSSCASSEACTPAKAACPSTCFYRFEDTFGNRLDVERAQLSRVASPSDDGPAVSRMLIPRSAWNLFKPFPVETTQPKARTVSYCGNNRQGKAVLVHNEDLWMDEKNPFLLTHFDLVQGKHEHLATTIIPTTSSLHLLSNSNSMWN